MRRYKPRFRCYYLIPGHHPWTTRTGASGFFSMPYFPSNQNEIIFPNGSLGKTNLIKVSLLWHPFRSDNAQGNWLLPGNLPVAQGSTPIESANVNLYLIRNLRQPWLPSDSWILSSLWAQTEAFPKYLMQCFLGILCKFSLNTRIFVDYFRRKIWTYGQKMWGNIWVGKIK